MPKVYDIIRKQWVTALPEEVMRQKLIRLMVNDLGYPPSLIAVEKELASLSYLKADDLGQLKRRMDIICFAKDIHPEHKLYPLLVIECKREKLTQSALDQVLGYNHYIRAFYIAIASPDELKTFWYSRLDGEYKSVDFLPSYKELLNSIMLKQHESMAN